jgi:hypothetical protein
MDRHGRQRLLKKNGQAIIEILPAILIFIMVLSACLRYFEVFRDAVEKEQVARNLMFAKIGNSGTLTTPASQLTNPGTQDPSTNGIQFDIEGGRVPVLVTNAFVDRSVGCFAVFPPSWKKQTPTSDIFAPGSGGGFPPVQVNTYAVIHRNASTPSCPF